MTHHFHLSAGAQPVLNTVLFNQCVASLGQPIKRLDNYAAWAATPSAELIAVAHQAEHDTASLPAGLSWKDFSLLAMDMDSTLINIECIDEIADYCGKKAEVAAITEAAMRGEITDYNDSLRRRVALLKGLPISALAAVLKERLSLNPGAEHLVNAAHQAGLETLLVSGGFTYFTDAMKARLNLTHSRSNVLIETAGVLTGEVATPIVNAELKRDTVQARCAALGVSTQRAIAMGDGSNDLVMMGVSGLSVAYHAKPAVVTKAQCAIRFGGLDTLNLWLSAA